MKTGKVIQVIHYVAIEDSDGIENAVAEYSVQRDLESGLWGVWNEYAYPGPRIEFRFQTEDLAHEWAKAETEKYVTI